jgi:hypothetical protein
MNKCEGQKSFMLAKQDEEFIKNINIVIYKFCHIGAILGMRYWGCNKSWMHRFVLFIYSSIHILIKLCGKDVNFASNSNYDDPSKLVLSRTILSFIGNLLLSLQF